MRKRKFRKTGHKREELPSFLKNLQEIPNDIDIPQKIGKSKAYLGPIFFGGDQCTQYHPPHQLAPLASFHNVQRFAPLKENILKDIFKPLSIKAKSTFESPEFRPSVPRERKFVDLYTHRCPGARKTFAPDPHVIEGLGKTVSKIEGETSREIPFYRVKKVISHCFVDEEAKPELEIVTLSDIREERIQFLPYKERIAHAHFPKEFATVEVIGPTIPASIIITKLPSKRQTSFAFDAHLKSNSKKTEGRTNGEPEHETAEEVETGAEEEGEKSKTSIDSLATGGEASVRASDKRPSQKTEEGRDRTESKIISDSEREEKGAGEEATEDEERKASEVLEEEATEGEERKASEVLEEEATKDEERNASEVVEEKAEDFQEAVQEENPPEE